MGGLVIYLLVTVIFNAAVTLLIYHTGICDDNGFVLLAGPVS